MSGKKLLRECSKSSPGFSTIHVMQIELGLSRGHLLRHFLRASVDDGDGYTPWKPMESPGCSDSFHKFYSHYIQDENLYTGRVGEAYCLLVPSTQRALAVERDILSVKPTFVDCGRMDCLTCGFRTYQAWRIPRTLLVCLLGYVVRRLSRER